MILSLALLICLSSSYSSRSSIFIGEWSLRDKLKKDDSQVLLELFFYQVKNYKNESILQLINSDNSNINNISIHDDFIFVIGNATFADSIQSNFLMKHELLVGVYQTTTSDIYMVSNCKNYLPINTIQKINNCSNKLSFSSDSEFFNFFNKMKSISQNFNYKKQEQSITYQDIKKFKLNNFRKTNIAKEKNKHIRNQILLNRLQHFVYVQFFGTNLYLEEEMNIPLVYLKANNNNKKALQCEIRDLLSGYLIFLKDNNIGFNFLELKLKQINISAYIQKAQYFFIIVIILTLLLMKKYKKICIQLHYSSKFRYLYITMYDFIFYEFIFKFFKEVYFINKGEFMHVFLDMLKYCMQKLCIKNALKIIKEDDAFFRTIKEMLQIIISFYLFKKITDKLFSSINAYSNFLIIYLSTCLIPQIIFNFFNRYRNMRMTVYMILLTYFHYFEISYYFWFIKETKKMLILLFLIITIQSIVLLVQNVFRSAFCTRKQRINGEFNYFKQIPHQNYECPICYSEIIPEKNNYMITPCNHVFHEECLGKWMILNNICPYCRGELPEIKNFPSFL